MKGSQHKSSGKPFASLTLIIKSTHSPIKSYAFSILSAKGLSLAWPSKSVGIKFIISFPEAFI